MLGYLGVMRWVMRVWGLEELGGDLGKGLEVGRWRLEGLGVLGEVGGIGVGELSDWGKGVLVLVGGWLSSHSVSDVDVVDRLGEVGERVRVQSGVYIHSHHRGGGCPIFFISWGSRMYLIKYGRYL